MRKLFSLACFVVGLAAVFTSCNPVEQEHVSIPYDSSKPVVLNRFYPDSGGMATKMIIEGSNFGLGTDETDINSRVKVYFNSKKSAVVRSVGDMIYCITPRQPGKGNTDGDTCVISVVVGTDSAVFKDNHFMYYTTTTVSTVAGVTSELTEADQDAARTGGTLSTARFSRPRFLCSDDEGNVYLGDWNAVWGSGSLYIINQEADVVTELASGYRPCAPCMSPDGESIWVPDDGGTSIYLYSITNEFSQTKIVPTDQSPGEWTYQYKHSLAPCNVQEDGVNYIYTVTCMSGNSQNYLAKINPNTGTITPILDMIPTDEAGTTINDENSWCFLAFDPINPHMLYISLYQKHVISRYNVLTKEYESAWAGEKGTADHEDGRLTNAKFSNPSQLCVDYDGNLFIADAGNHCIRRISPDGMVTTVIGQPGTAGSLDGGPDDALFNFPEGVTVTPDNTVWIADTNNDLLRKLAIE